jgi:2-methylcitrate dehydratase PrpD
MRTTRELGDYVARTGLRDFAPEVVERTKELCLSALGAAVYGVSMEATRILADHARASDGPEEACVIGAGFRTSAELAALVNAAASHNTELEDVALAEAMPTVNFIPPLFALAEKLGTPGGAVLEAVILAFEISARPAVILANAPGGCTERGFQPGPIFAPIGVAAAGAKMMGLSTERIVHAMSLAASLASGLGRQVGSGAHVVEPGFAGRNGITAALLARAGMTGDPTVLEGKGGFWDAVGSHGDIDFDLGTGSDLRVMEVGLKRYPCCYFLQRILDGVRDIIADAGLGADQVACVTVEGNAFFRKIIRYDEPTTSDEARFSLPHSVAVALTGDVPFFVAFDEAAIRNPRYRAHWAKVRYAPYADQGGGTEQREVPITITLQDGTAHRRICTTHKGDPRNPLSREEVVDRFKLCTEHHLAPAQIAAAAQQACALDEAPSVAPLMSLLTYAG